MHNEGSCFVTAIADYNTCNLKSELHCILTRLFLHNVKGPAVPTLLKQLVGRSSQNRDKVADTYSIPNPGITVIPTLNSMTFIPYR